MGLRVLIIGNGGREHALAWKAARSPLADRVFVAPGNGGTALEPGVENVPIPASDIEALCAFALEKTITLTIVGPEAPLCAGVVDAFQERGLACLGPNRAAAALEGSKSFAKVFMARNGIPTAPYAVFSDFAAAAAYLKTQPYPVVIKADGLAGGKGVLIVQDRHQAMEALRALMALNTFGAAGHRVVIEEWVAGEEASFIVLTDGEHVLPLASSQDHKTLEEGDRGPNTGGMGAYSPATVISEAMQNRILKEIIEPTLNGMQAINRPYRGFLYAGLMVREDGSCAVLEFNCRLGDPETQAILPRLQSDLIALCQAALKGDLVSMRAQWDPRSALGVVAVSRGYPGEYRSGRVNHGLDHHQDPEVTIFHAGTALCDGEIITAGGRVLCVCALGNSLAEAQRKSYQRMQSVHWPGMYYRRDIGHRGLVGRFRGSE